jgi:hypothetical protein
VIQLGAENNIEKSGCLAQNGKKYFSVDAIRPYFSGSKVSAARVRTVISAT